MTLPELSINGGSGDAAWFGRTAEAVVDQQERVRRSASRKDLEIDRFFSRPRIGIGDPDFGRIQLEFAVSIGSNRGDPTRPRPHFGVRLQADGVDERTDGEFAEEAELLGQAIRFEHELRLNFDAVGIVFEPGRHPGDDAETRSPFEEGLVWGDPLVHDSAKHGPRSQRVAGDEAAELLVPTLREVILDSVIRGLDEPSHLDREWFRSNLELRLTPSIRGVRDRNLDQLRRDRAPARAIRTRCLIRTGSIIRLCSRRPTVTHNTLFRRVGSGPMASDPVRPLQRLGATCFMTGAILLAVTFGCAAPRPNFSESSMPSESAGSRSSSRQDDADRSKRPPPYLRRLGIIRADLRSREYGRAMRRLERFLSATKIGLERPEGAPSPAEVRDEILGDIARSGDAAWGSIFDERQLEPSLKLALLDTIARNRIYGPLPTGEMNAPGALATRKVALGSRVVELELALTSQARNAGFMLRTHIPEDRGMLFLFPFHDLRRFWAKDCYIEMDLAFVEERSGKFFISDIHTLTPQPDPVSDEDYVRYPSSAPVRIAIEMRAHWFRDHGFKVGTELDLGKLLEGLEAQ